MDKDEISLFDYQLKEGTAYYHSFKKHIAAIKQIADYLGFQSEEEIKLYRSSFYIESSLESLCENLPHNLNYIYENNELTARLFIWSWHRACVAIRLLESPLEESNIEQGNGIGALLERVPNIMRPNYELAINAFYDSVKGLEYSSDTYIAKYQSGSSIQKKGGDEAARRYEKAKTVAALVARGIWQEGGGKSEVLKIGKAAKKINKLMKDNPNVFGFERSAAVPNEDTIRRWIRPLAPEEASKAGRSKLR
ncbi:MAG: hypothetical protein RLP12_12995 [Ekhidna sp.]